MDRCFAFLVLPIIFAHIALQKHWGRGRVVFSELKTLLHRYNFASNFYDKNSIKIWFNLNSTKNYFCILLTLSLIQKKSKM